MRLRANQLQTTSIRHVAEHGTDYVVAPVVAVVAGVLNGELLPADELHAQAWEGKPVTLGHPRRGEQYVSAQDEAARVLGTLRHMAKAEDNRLTGEIWLDVGQVAALGGEAVSTLAAMAAGKPLEVSTGYWCHVEGVTGVFNGEAYNGVQRGLEPDHLAILLHEEGACNWADGCGTPRVNQAGDNGVMVAFYPAPGDAAALALAAGDVPAGSVVTPAEELHLTLAYLGSVDDLPGVEMRLLEAVGDLSRRMPVVRGEVSGIGRFGTDEGNDLQALYASFDGPYLPEWRAALVEVLEYGVGQGIRREHGFTPHLTLAYVPKDAPTAMLPPAGRPMAFDRVSVVWGERRTDFPLLGEAVELAANSRRSCGCQREERTMQDVQNQVEEVVEATPEEIAPAVEEMAAEETPTLLVEDEPVVNAQAETQAETQAEVQAETPAQEALPAEVAAAAALIAEMGGVGAVKEALTLLRANRDAAREVLVSELTANQACAFSRADLEAMSSEHLQKLAQSLRTPSYSGRGGVRANMQDEWVVYQPPVPAAK